MWKEQLTANSQDEVEILSDIKAMGEFRSDDNDDQLKIYHDMAEKYIQRILDRPLLSESWALYYDRNQMSKKTDLQGMNVTAIDSFEVTDSEGNVTTVASSNYRLSNGYIIFDKTSPFDSVSPRFYDAVKITVTAGFASTRDDLPEDLKKAIAVLVVNWYEYTPQDFSEFERYIPEGFSALVNHFSNINRWIA